MDCRLLCPEASVANTGAAGASVRSGIIFPADAAEDAARERFESPADADSQTAAVINGNFANTCWAVEQAPSQGVEKPERLVLPYFKLPESGTPYFHNIFSSLWYYGP